MPQSWLSELDAAHPKRCAPFPPEKGFGDKMELPPVKHVEFTWGVIWREASIVVMILPQVHLRKPCYDLYFL